VTGSIAMIAITLLVLRETVASVRELAPASADEGLAAVPEPRAT
jgi:hypothetical protein